MRWRAAGAAGTALLAVGSLVVGTRPSIDAPGWLGYVVAYVGLTVLVATWLHLGLAIGGGAPLTAPWARRTLAAWSAPLLVVPPLFSRDAYSYVAQGRLADLGLDPYRYGPARLGAGPYLDAVGPIWRHATSPYGPLFVGLESTTTRLAPGVTAGVFGMRALAVVGLVLLARYLPRLAVAHGVDERLALWLGLLDPLVVAHLVGGAHNDALMLGLVVAGLALAAEGRPGPGVVLAALAAAVKLPAGLAVVYLVADELGVDRRRGLRSLALAGLTFGAVTLVVGWGWGWIGAVGTPGRVHSMLSPTTALGTLLGGIGGHPAAAVTFVRAAGLVVAVALLPLLLLARHRVGSIRMLGLSLLAVVAFGPVVQPWYLLWGLVVLAGTGIGSLLPVAVWVAAVLPYLVLPDGTVATDVVLVTFLALTATAWWATRRWSRLAPAAGGTPATPRLRRRPPPPPPSR